jgi:hypothetical protein
LVLPMDWIFPSTLWCLAAWNEEHSTHRTLSDSVGLLCLVISSSVPRLLRLTRSTVRQQGARPFVFIMDGIIPAWLPYLGVVPKLTYEI